MLWLPVNTTTLTTKAATGQSRQDSARNSASPEATTSGIAEVATVSGHAPREKMSAT
jgi:hypothetical protein